MDKIFKVVQMGLGPIGTGVTKYLIEKSNIEIVGAIDRDLSKCGKDLGSIAGLSNTGIIIFVNSIPNLIQSTPVLKTMLDINPPHYHL
jgi:4-hydroxy-tetrahydrodipicolinate reductase